MLLVADSGSTKADWLLADKGKVIGSFNTVGFNPYFHDAKFVFETLSNSEALAPYSSSVSELYFFGAGCSNAKLKAIIAEGLQQYFKNARVIVDHDMLASAYATCGDEKGIACILGTGSNSCYYDGRKVHEKNYGLGYILGDEGSGSYYGKKLVTWFLYGLLPKHLHDDFFDQNQLDKNSIVSKIYNQPNANVWLASLAVFLTRHKDDAFIKDLIRKGMREFMELYVIHYDNYKQLPVHFVGTLAFLFQVELKEVAADLDIKIEKIIKQPVEELMKYFLKKHA
jgi:N-acetylglucosamine kinase-like BadF-type ATPase